MTTTDPQLSVTRVVRAPRDRVYRAFTDPDDFVAWWGPIGNALPRDEIEFDVRPGGSLRWSELFPEQPEIRTHVRVQLTKVIDGVLLDGLLQVTGVLPGGFEPFETRMRVEFYDEGDGWTRLEIRQWLPEHFAAPSEAGWAEAFAKLDAFLDIRL